MVMVDPLSIPLVLSITIQVHSSARVLRGLVLPLPVHPIEISTYFRVVLVEADWVGSKIRSVHPRDVYNPVHPVSLFKSPSN